MPLPRRANHTLTQVDWPRHPAKRHGRSTSLAVDDACSVIRGCKYRPKEFDVGIPCSSTMLCVIVDEVATSTFKVIQPKSPK